MAARSANESTPLFVVGDASDSTLRRFKDGSSGEEGEAVAGEEFAALCINFIVNSLEDIDFGALPGVLVAADIAPVLKLSEQNGFQSTQTSRETCDTKRFERRSSSLLIVVVKRSSC